MACFFPGGNSILSERKVRMTRHAGDLLRVDTFTGKKCCQRRIYAGFLTKTSRVFKYIKGSIENVSGYQIWKRDWQNE